MIPLIFVPCTLILTTLTTKGWCSISEKQLEFKRDILATLSFVHDINSCTFKQIKSINTVQGSIQAEIKLVVECKK